MDLPERGEVWWADVEVGARPVVVLSRDAAIRGRRRSMVAACSTTVRGPAPRGVGPRSAAAAASTGSRRAAISYS